MFCGKIDRPLSGGAALQTLRCMIFHEREDKLAAVAQLFSNYLTGDVLDVGCDTKHLSRFVQGRYVGVDIAGAPDIRVNLEDGSPFRDRSFDTVIAFDVLEHLDWLHFAFDELCRISRSYVIVGLPNVYEWHFRAMFLLGKRLGGKWGLACEPPTDRHRWVFNFEEARNFVRQRGAKNGFIVAEEIVGYYDYQCLMPKLVTLVGKIFGPRGFTLFACRYGAVLKREDETLLACKGSMPIPLRCFT
jgi:SAM-dependent methyltransferase